MRNVTRTRLLLPALVVALACLLAAVGLRSARAAASGKGLVVIETTLGYAGGRAAGTGMVLTSTGEILTNNHVIRGATAIRVVVPGGRSYSGRVVGYDVADDVAVLRLRGATHLSTVRTGTGARLRIGQIVTATGNAGGTGRLRTVTGQVTALSRTITASDGEGDSERLTGLIETSASVVAGDSGGALEDTAGRVVGLITAASGNFVFQDVPVSDGYAIPIAKAISIVRLIEAGKTTARVHVGPTAFLGVSLAAGSGAGGGVLVAGVSTGGPADGAGLEPGDVIVGLDGRPVGSAKALRAALFLRRPGQTVQIAYLDGSGARHTATATLASGPPQ